MSVVRKDRNAGLTTDFTDGTDGISKNARRISRIVARLISVIRVIRGFSRPDFQTLAPQSGLNAHYQLPALVELFRELRLRAKRPAGRGGPSDAKRV